MTQYGDGRPQSFSSSVPSLLLFIIVGIAFVGCGDSGGGGPTTAASLSTAYIDKIDSIPDYLQTDMDYGGFPNGGSYYCGPAATSNSLLWLSDNGFPGLSTHTADRKRDQFDVITILGSAPYMNTGSVIDGTTCAQLLDGTKRYIRDRGYTYISLQYQGLFSVPHEFDTGVRVPDLAWAKRGVRGRGSVLLHVGWYRYDSGSDVYTKVSGHYVTLVGYGHDGSAPDPNYIIIHDPGATAGRTFANEYVFPIVIASGTLTGTPEGSRSAVGFYKLRGGMHVSPNADFGILLAAIVLAVE